MGAPDEFHPEAHERAKEITGERDEEPRLPTHTNAEEFRASFERARDPVREIREDAFLPAVGDLGLSYTLALIDPGSVRQEPDISDLDLPATIVLTGSDLDHGIKAADLCSDHITLRADKDGEAFHMEAEGDAGDVDLEIPVTRLDRFASNGVDDDG